MKQESLLAVSYLTAFSFAEAVVQADWVPLLTNVLEVSELLRTKMCSYASWAPDTLGRSVLIV